MSFRCRIIRPGAGIEFTIGDRTYENQALIISKEGYAMSQFTDAISYFFRYYCRVLPEARRQEDMIQKRQRLCTPVPVHKDDKSRDDLRPGQFRADKLCCFMFSLFPHTDMKGFLTFILSLYGIGDVLESHRKRKDIRDEHEIRSLFSCLMCAVDPSRNCICSMSESRKNVSAASYVSDGTAAENTSVRCNADQCRLQLALLPSYKKTAGVIKKYIQLYIDLQSYRHYPQIISIEALKTWSANHLSRYDEIYFWEFCAAADTFIGIAAMYAAASVPNIADKEIRLLDELCFPWLCGLISLLGSAISARHAIGTDELNFSSFYNNLKECEDRIMFFAGRTEEACRKLQDSSLYMHVIKAMTAVYISDPETNFSMLRLTASNIAKRFSLRTYRNAALVSRCIRLI
jgi:tetraprenyl-beta-curcumene synthase